MDLKTFIKGLQKVVKDNPSAKSLKVVTSSDDEGNSFKEIVFTPTRGNIDGNEMEFDTKDYNAICVN